MNFLKRWLGAEPDHDIKTVDQPVTDGSKMKIEYLPVQPAYFVLPGDIFQLTVSEDGKEMFKHSEPINIPMTIDTAAVFRIRDALGFEHAICGAFGQRKRS